ncbi:hypothetical protein C5167_028390 [Papaver somniferum]|nr:hypothetical protein C5167_028390 [Papaver somniferum]
MGRYESQIFIACVGKEKQKIYTVLVAQRLEPKAIAWKTTEKGSIIGEFSEAGITSGWFCLESTLLTLFMTAGAVMFVRDRTAKNARRMFHGSLLYLPIFVSGMLFHRISENQQTLTATTPGLFTNETQAQNGEDDRHIVMRRKGSSIGIQSRAPVAYASIAPFPFLPVLIYADSEL